MITSKEQLLTELKRIDGLILVYSTMDWIRVEELTASKRVLEEVLMGIMSRENDLWLSKIKTANEALIASKKR